MVQNTEGHCPVEREIQRELFAPDPQATYGVAQACRGLGELLVRGRRLYRDDLRRARPEQHPHDPPRPAADVGDFRATKLRRLDQRFDEIREQGVGAVIAFVLAISRPLLAEVCDGALTEGVLRETVHGRAGSDMV